MLRRFILAALVGLLFVSSAAAQASGWRFRWHKGQVLTYRVEQVTSIAEVVGETKTNVRNKLSLVKRWQVQDVDDAGVGTLHLSLTAMRNEITRPDGEVLLYDSADPSKGTAELREQLAKYVGTTLAVIRVDGKGNVVEVKESKHGPASRFESDPPFKIVLPDAEPQQGNEWSRPYRITLDPPQGTGEKYDASQTYACKSISGTSATIALTTAIPKLPESLLDQVPLLQMQPAGEVMFDTRAGVMLSARLGIDRELKNHQGEGSSYRFQSTYTEVYAGAK
jgi:hypothetical protein